VEKERPVTIDRFLWHGRIQSCDLMAKVMRKEHNYSVCIAILQLN